MVIKACRKPCRHPGCKELTYNTYCGQHEKKKQEEIKVERIKYDNSRGTAHSRGYSYRWQKYSKQYRIDHPLCEICLKNDILELSECVDHIIPVFGPEDPLFWEPTNHQAISNKCHNIKSEAEGNRYNKERNLNGRIG